MEKNRLEAFSDGVLAIIITIASGYARFDPALDKSTRTVIERADEKMYKRKRELKSETD